jgi:uncharacterized membrane protein
MIALRKVDPHPDKQSIRRFALTLLIGLSISGLLLSGIASWIRGSLSLVPFLALSGAAMLGLILSLLSEKAGRAIHIVWHAISAAIEWCLSLISLALMYYAVIAPVALAMWLFRRQSPLTPVDKSRPSYWVDSQAKRDLASYFRQY